MNNLRKAEGNTNDFDSSLQGHEGLIMRMGADTFRGVHDHPELLQCGIDLTKELRGKVVGDLGSGHGGLSATAYAEGITSDVFSINPAFRPDYPEDFKSVQESVFRKTLRQKYPDISENEIADALENHDAHRIASFAHDIDLPDNFFDVLVDTVAVHQYMADNPDVYEATIKEMCRVLKPGGKIIVEGGSWELPPQDSPRRPFNEADVLDKLGIKYKILKIPVEVEDGEAPSDHIIGAIIYKPSIQGMASRF